ncbi:MAG: BlaI/MecI/CopY family transcriptional regulator [Pirellulaceae bacterium]
MSTKHHLATLQLAIMQVLWDRKEATVGDVRDALLPDRPLAYTTVSTMLSKMEQNGQVAHRNVGRMLVYRAAIRRDTVRKSMVTDLAVRLFRGDVTEMVSHLLDDCEVSTVELSRLKSLIREKETEMGDGS